MQKEEDYKTRFKIKKYGNLRTHLPSSLDEALLNSIVENRPLKQTFICAPQQLPSVVKSFGKYQDKVEKMSSRNKNPLQAKLCKKRWRVVSLVMSV